jgi:hypothetical protein
VKCFLVKSRNSRLRPYGILRTDHAIPLYPQKLALTSPTSGGRSVGIVRSWTEATELITFCKCSKNSATNPTPVCSHSKIMRILTYMSVVGNGSEISNYTTAFDN